MNCYLGVDIGTSSAKMVVIDQKGDTIAQCSREYSFDQPKQGWKEIDPDVWYVEVMKGLKDMLALVDRKRIKGIGITGQMHTVIFMGKDGKSIRPAIMWNDNRTKECLAELKENIKKVGDQPFIEKIISTGSPAANLYWLKLNEPDNFKLLHKFLIGPDYLVYRFTGKMTTDYCEASTSSLYDIERRVWSKAVAELIGLSENVYPQIKGSSEQAGLILDEVAEELGLSKGLAIITGTGDNPATGVSSGCFSNTSPILSLGTSAVLMFRRSELDLDAKGKNILFSADGKLVHILNQGVVQSAGNSYSWISKEILEIEEFGKGTEEISIDRLGENQVLFYPHLAGEKTIYGDPALKGAFIGLTLDTKRMDLLIAVMEGVSFGIRQLMDEMKLAHLDVLRVTGGGSNSTVWMQILSDILNVKVETILAGSGASQGVALLSAYANGEFTSLDEIGGKAIKANKTYYPRSYNTSLYDDQYRKYRKIYTALKAITD
ncbi:xylulokinase [Youngiibacter multivorans]|uniref:Xylulokinase n=1 Tax=Youngiibacter multivorans TaxID=937251 RepID=A0ABS4G7D1_9CLOT|nr:FGGY family carbohydrate kinase [Youngiibacter multivorans]MBP1920464.1 xylulokinase [Youngiibacter multivorans]